MSQAAWFKLYGRHQAMFDALSNEQAGKVIKAALSYMNTGEVVEMDPIALVAFAVLKEDIDHSIADYQEICEKNKQNIRKRWAGKAQNAPEPKSVSREERKKATLDEIQRTHPP